jgi:GNAT superfamily N-acetyltransferase
MELPHFNVIDAGPQWADKYRSFCRRAYLKAYVRPELGITEGQFSKSVFDSPRVVKYFQDAFNTSNDHKAWLAISIEDILGGVVAYNCGDYCEMQAFYVEPELIGSGIGHALYQKVLGFAGDLPIQVDVVRYMTSTVAMYKHWGFEVDESKGEVEYNWVEWPEKARQVYRGIYMVKPGKLK